jgi:hypothetical protein
MLKSFAAIVAERQALLKKYATPLLMQIHPDFFAAHAAQRAVNQASMQTLNTHLAHVKSIKSDTALLSELLLNEFWNKPVDLKFYLRASPSDQTIHHVGSVVTAKSVAKLSKMDRRFPTFLYCDRVMLGFMDLCRQARVPVPDSAFSETQDRVSKMHDMATKGHADTFHSGNNQVLEWRRTFERELRNDSGRRESDGPPGGSMQDMLDFFRGSSKFFFDKDLTTEEKTITMVTFWENVDELNYEMWRHLPVLVRRAYSRRDAGFLTIPFDFNPIGITCLIS